MQTTEELADAIKEMLDNQKEHFFMRWASYAVSKLEEKINEHCVPFCSEQEYSENLQDAILEWKKEMRWWIQIYLNKN